jgi:hypothetical protein
MTTSVSRRRATLACVMALVPRAPLAVAVVLLVAGVVLLALDATVPGFVALGLGAIGAVSLFFYAVGRSEDIDRERNPRG